MLFDAYREEFALGTPLLHELASPVMASLAVLGRRVGFISGHPGEQPAPLE